MASILKLIEVTDLFNPKNEFTNERERAYVQKKLSYRLINMDFS